MKERTRIDARFYICVFVNDAAHVCENRIKMINMHIHMCTLIMELNEPTLIRMTSASVRYLTLHIGDLISRDVKILPRHVRGNMKLKTWEILIKQNKILLSPLPARFAKVQISCCIYSAIYRSVAFARFSSYQ